MKRFLAILALLFFSCVALADPTLSSAKTFASGLTPPSTDYSVAYLSQIFGTVGNVLQGSSGQILGKMFYVFNMGVLVVAALWLGMTTVQTVIRGATEGSFMGANKNVHFMLLRIALGFGLVLPSSTTGYSIFQDLYMKVVVEGVALADQTWDAALNYIMLGGQLFIPPKHLDNDGAILTKAIGYPPSATLSTIDASTIAGTFALGVLRDEVCMLKSEKTQKDHGWLPNPTSGSSYQVLPDLHPDYSKLETSGVISFPYYSGSAQPGGCGSVTSYFYTSGAVQGSHAASVAPYSNEALQSLVTGLLPVASIYVSHQLFANFMAPIPGSSADQDRYQKILSKGLMSGVVAYMNLMNIYQSMTAGVAGGSNDDSLNVLGMLQAAKDQGWIMAGGFYWAVEEANSTSQRADISNLIPQVTLPAKTTIGTDNDTDLNTSSQYFYSLGNIVNHYWVNYVGAQKNTIDLSNVTGSQSNSDSNSAAAALSQNALGDAIQSIFQLNQSNAYNPIVILMHEGNNLLIGVVSTWVLAISISTALAAAAGFCNSVSPAGLMFKTAMGWLKSIMMLITTAMLVPGAILAYYLPMYPFAVFTFAAIGWFAMVIEGMAAAPLVCFGMTHPEGHDFLGKGEQALMLILGIFLRPTLLVIGLIAFMLTSFVAFELLLAGLGPLMNSFRSTHSGALNDDFLILISITVMLVIFGFMTMEIIEQSAKIIYQLPNNIMRWIGGPQTGEEYGQMAGQLKGAVSAGAEQAGRVGQAGVEAGMELGKEYTGVGARDRAKDAGVGENAGKSGDVDV